MNMTQMIGKQRRQHAAKILMAIYFMGGCQKIMFGYGMFNYLFALGWKLIPIMLVMGAVGYVIYRLTPPSKRQGPVRPGAAYPCPRCKKYVQNDWKTCPHCGQKLSG